MQYPINKIRIVNFDFMETLTVFDYLSQFTETHRFNEMNRIRMRYPCSSPEKASEY